jgi:YjbE family integral membrane protein
MPISGQGQHGVIAAFHAWSEEVLGRMGIADLHFWIGFGQIVGIDLVLSGDNAVVIALASRGLPSKHRRVAVLLGAGAAVLLRVGFAFVVFELLSLPYLRLIGGAMLLWVAIHLGRPQPKATAAENAAPASLWDAVRTIVLADLLMSIDNVVAIAGAARGSLLLLILGLGISIPLVIYGSALMLRLIDRFAWIVALGIALIGWVAGDMIAAEPALSDFFEGHVPSYHYLLPLAGIALALASYRIQARMKR